MDNGWVKLHRQMFSNKLWLSEKFTKAQAWVDLFANANHEDGSFWIRGIEVKIKRGQIGWSELTMTERWHWSKNRVRRFLKWLETEQQIEQQKYLYITTIITIINYNKYQETEQQTIQQKDSKRYINKNVKNDKNVKNREIVEQAPPPSHVNNDFFQRGEEYQKIRKILLEKIPESVVDRELDKFVLYWTEPNKSGTKVRWQQQQTFEIKRRVKTWLLNMKERSINNKYQVGTA